MCSHFLIITDFLLSIFFCIAHFAFSWVQTAQSSKPTPDSSEFFFFFFQFLVQWWNPGKTKQAKKNKQQNQII